MAREGQSERLKDRKEMSRRRAEGTAFQVGGLQHGGAWLPHNCRKRGPGAHLVHGRLERQLLGSECLQFYCGHVKFRCAWAVGTDMDVRGDLGCGWGETGPGDWAPGAVLVQLGEERNGLERGWEGQSVMGGEVPRALNC